MKALQNIAFSLIGFIVTLGVIEGGLRLLSVNSSVSRWSDRPTSYYKHQASASMQDYSYSQEKPENTYRIVVLGDSFTFAPYMQFDDAFPKRLERMLNLNSSDLTTEVLNQGVPGFSTSHEFNSAKQSLSYKPDLFLLQITLNDPQLKPYQPTGLQGPNEFGAYTPSEDIAGLYEKSALLKFILSRLHNTATHDNYKNYYFELFEKERNWKYFSQNIKKLVRLGKKHNIPVVATIFPLFGLPLDESYPFHPIHQKIGNLLKELELPYLDLFSTFEGIPLDRVQVIPAVDFHPNEIGHRMAAEALYEWLATSDILPNKLLIKDRFKDRIDIRVMDSNRVEPLARATPFVR